jgi:hypothetical protein
MRPLSQRILILIAVFVGAVLPLAATYRPALLVEYGPPDESVHLKTFQYADVVGVGKAVGHHDNALVIDVREFWAGSFATNPVTIYEAFGDWSDGLPRDSTNYYAGKDIVFFATTNEVKNALPLRPTDEFLILDDTVSFTNHYGYCPPKFVYPNPPTWYALETNDVAHLAFFSNIVNSIVVARNRTLLYTTLRDAIESDETGEQPYRGMSFRPMSQLLWTASEDELIAALNDPLLAPRLRSDALFNLKKRFGWP